MYRIDNVKNLEIQLNQIKSLHPHFQGEKNRGESQIGETRINPERGKREGERRRWVKRFRTEVLSGRGGFEEGGILNDQRWLRESWREELIRWSFSGRDKSRGHSWNERRSFVGWDDRHRLDAIDQIEFIAIFMSIYQIPRSSEWVLLPMNLDLSYHCKVAFWSGGWIWSSYLDE